MKCKFCSTVSLFTIFFLAFIYCPVAFTGEVDYSSISDHLNVVRQVEAETLERLSDDNFSSADRAARIKAEYRKLFDRFNTNRLLESGSVTTIGQFFEATALVAFYNPSTEFIGKTEKIYETLKRRGASNLGHARHLFKIYVGARAFRQAERLASGSGFPLGDVPKIESQNQSHRDGIASTSNDYRVYLYANSADVLVEQQLSDQDLRESIIVIAHPLCSFTRQAIEDLYGEIIGPDNSDGAEFLWLIPPQGGLPSRAVAALKEKYPGINFGLIGSLDGWKEVDELQTPTFYSINPGGKTDVIIGWKGDETEVRLRDLVASVDKRSARN